MNQSGRATTWSELLISCLWLPSAPRTPLPKACLVPLSLNSRTA